MKIKKHQYAIPNFGKNWDDLPPIPLINQRVAAVNVPSLTAMTGNIYQLTFAVNDYVFGSQEFVHAYKEGTDIMAHVHFVTNGSEGTNKYVNWELEYSIANGDGSAPYESAFPTPTIISSGDVLIPANTADRSHIIVPIGTISGTGIKIGSYITYRFRRIASTGTAPVSAPFALAIGFHVEQNTIGSRQIFAK